MQTASPPITLDLTLEERTPNRVVINVCVEPTLTTAHLDGVRLHLRTASGRELSPRLMLPIRGELASPMATTIELRSQDTIPPGASVEAYAWDDASGAHLTVTCPADAFPRLRDHMHGSRRGLKAAMDAELRPLHTDERQRLLQALPWVAEPLTRPTNTIEVHEPTAAQEEAFVDGLGLDSDCADWLKDLLNEDEG